MARLISAIFEDAHKAEDAARALAARYGAAAVTALAPKAAAKTVQAQLTKSGLPETETATYAAAIKSGQAYVSVKAPWGTAKRATEILRAHSPAAINAHTPPGEEMPQVEQRFLLSAALNWTLLSDDTTPLSRYWGLQLLANDFSLSKKLGWSTNGVGPTPLSSMFGLKLLSDTPAPLSQALGLQLLSDEPTPLSKRLGVAVLSTKDFFFPTRPTS